jgi:hypothetical protein
VSVLTYDGVQLPYGSTTKFLQQAIRDDSNTDWICTTFDIQMQTIINVAYLSQLAPDMIPGNTNATPVNPVDIMSVIRARLMRHRRSFSFKFDGVEMIPQNAGGVPGNVDAQNGPMPQSCSYFLITNTTFLLTYHIIAKYWENVAALGAGNDFRANNQQGAAVLYNRWAETVEIDYAGFSTRVREGKYAIRSDNSFGFIADQLRSGMAVLGLPAGWLRESSRYTVTPDGLAIQYRIQDREQYKMPPQQFCPVYKAEGTYTEYQGRAGAMRHGEVHVRLEGGKNTNMALLVYTTMALAGARLITGGGGIGANTLGVPIIESVRTMVDLYKNIVEAQWRAMLRPGVIMNIPNTAPNLNGRIAGSAGWKMMLNVETPFSPSTAPPSAPPYFARGWAGRLVQAAAYYDPSIGGNLNPTTGQLGKGLEPGQAGITLEP